MLRVLHGHFMKLTLNQAIKKGVEAHQAGDIKEEEKLYKYVLQSQPANPDANHNMGILAVEMGNIQDSLTFFRAALISGPNVSQFWVSYISALINIGHLAEAMTAFNQAKKKGIRGGKFNQLEKKIAAQRLKENEANALKFKRSTALRPNTLDTVTLDQALRLAEKKIKEGKPDEAKFIYQEILKTFPKNKRSLTALKSINAHKKLAQNPTSEQMQSLINLYTQGRLQETLTQCELMLKRFPNSIVIYNILGASNVGLKQHDAAIKSYKQALKIEPEYADAYYNMGIALDKKGNASAAIDSYRQAININPDYAAAYNNMGFSMNFKGDYRAAIDSYKKAVEIKPDYAEAFNNMANTLKDMGNLEAAIEKYGRAIEIRPGYFQAYNNLAGALNDKGDTEAAVEHYKKALKVKPDYAEAYYNMGMALDHQCKLEEAVDSYNKALIINPRYAEAQSNLATLLATYIPKKEISNVIVTVNKQIQSIDISDYSVNIISDDKVVAFYSKSSKYINDSGLKMKIKGDQTYRRNSVNLNCKRHISIFNIHNVIPEFCFGCYKVQVEPRSVIELIKLFFVFDQLELKENNSRKCMIEKRRKIPGFYKGLIYCSSLEQANQISAYLDQVIVKRIGLGLTSKVKRGCSEFPASFPNFKEINNTGPQLMSYDDEWKVIEEEYDKKNFMPIAKRRPNVPGINLSDVLSIQKWIDYARGIGDTSADSINQNSVYHKDIYDIAKARLDTFHFRN